MATSKVTVHPRRDRGHGPLRRAGAGRTVPPGRAGGVRGAVPRARRDGCSAWRCGCSATPRMPRICCRRFSCRRTGSWRASAASRRSGTWLYRLAMNQILDHVRSRAARTGQLTDGLDDASVLADAGGHRLADRAIDRDRSRARARASCRKDAAPRSCCTTSKGWSTRKSPRCSASRRARRSRRCTRRGCGCGAAER